MSRRPSSRPPPVEPLPLLPITLALVVFFMVVGAAYALTPLGNLVDPARSGENAFLAPQAKAAKKVGAEAVSVVAPTRTAPTPAPLPTVAAQDTRFAFLLMGYGGGGHDGAYLTDSMMVVVVDAERKSLTLLSLPRDSWVPMSMNGKTTEYNKINTAYAFAKDPSLFPDRLPRYGGDSGAGNFASDTVSRLLGIPIRYYLALDFQGFRDMIDAVGGVDVEVPASFSARYPANDDPSIDASWKTVRFTRGPEHMGGERAIEFARARETLDNPAEGSDFARSRRQRLIMQAFKTRVLEPGGLIHLPQLIGIASKHVDTNYTIPDVAGLTQFALGWKNVTFFQTALTAANFLQEGTGPEGTYVLFPNAPKHSWGPIQAFMKRLWDDPATAVAVNDTTVVVENASTVPGAAARVSDDLVKLGYHLADPITAPRRATTLLIDKSGGKLGPVVARLRKDLGLPNLEIQEDASDPMPVLILEIGSDEAGLVLNVPNESDAPRSDVGVDKPTAAVPPTATPIRVIHVNPGPVRLPTPTEARPVVSVPASAKPTAVERPRATAPPPRSRVETSPTPTSARSPTAKPAG